MKVINWGELMPEKGQGEILHPIIKEFRQPDSGHTTWKGI
jgi:hypothetical protein